MTFASLMTAKIQLPTRTLFDGEVMRLTAIAPNGAFGIYPNHADFVTVIVPSVLMLALADGTETFFGLDDGIFLKKGHHVSVSVRRGVQGDDLGGLQHIVTSSFVKMDEEERQARSALSRLEADMVRRFAELQRSQI